MCSLYADSVSPHLFSATLSLKDGHCDEGGLRQCSVSTVAGQERLSSRHSATSLSARSDMCKLGGGFMGSTMVFAGLPG